jgi:hypothetical protein
MHAGQVFPLNPMERMSATGSTRGRAASAFTDIHFWIPAMVLLGGLLLLRFIH